MKKPLFMLLFVLAAVTAGAQVRLGIYGGIHSATVIETNNIPGWDATTKKNYAPLSGPHLGIIAEMPVGKKGLFIQTGFGYSSRGRKYNLYSDTSNVSDTVSYNSTLTINYIEIPFYVGYKLPLSASHKNSFLISAGPYLACYFNGQFNTTLHTNIGTTEKYSSTTEDLSVGNTAGQYQTYDVGINAHAGFELGNLVLTGYYSRGLTSFYTAPYGGTFRHQLVGATIGLWLTKREQPPVVIKDSDKDGIPDKEDLCPLQPGMAKYNGCPVPDTDHDGINDENDSCKTVAGTAKYNGCPIPDNDGDGINNEKDKCPNQPGVAKYNGCPIPDSDGDGINDEADKCPNVAGSAANQGCPLDTLKQVVKEKIDYTAKHILFLSGKAELTTGSYEYINDLSALLKIHSSWKVTIEGHTDSTGTKEHNIILSQKRADAIKKLLVEGGIESGRITTIGYGDQQPIGDNKTLEGRSANRRVEIKVIEQ